MKTKILITGASGVLGQTLLQKIQNQEIIVCSRNKFNSNNPSIQWAAFDLENPTPLNLQEVKTIFHLASSTQNFDYKTDVEGTKNLLNQALKNGVEHFIYISIVGVDKLPLKYFKIKYQVELEIQKSSIPYTILRTTQFLPFFEKEVSKYLKFPIGIMPTKILYQPIETEIVVQKLIQISEDQALNQIIELGGKETIELGHAAKALLEHRNQSKFILPIPMFLLGNLGQLLKNGALTTNQNSPQSPSWKEWLNKQDQQK